MNQRPPGYEPDELPSALSRDISIAWLLYNIFSKKSIVFLKKIIFLKNNRFSQDFEGYSAQLIVSSFISSPLFVGYHFSPKSTLLSFV